jgi:hypothetical protein
LNFQVLSRHNYFGDSIWLDLVDPNILLWYPLHYHDYPHRTIHNILKHILENVILQEPGGQLEIALEQHGCQSILDVMALTPWEIETFQWTNGPKPKDNIGRGYPFNVISLQDFVLSLNPSPMSMTTNYWIALTPDQFHKFQAQSTTGYFVPKHQSLSHTCYYQRCGAML